MDDAKAIESTFEVAGRLHVLACPQCGITFALPELLHTFKTHEQQPIACPNGHAVVYPDPLADAPLDVMVRLAWYQAKLHQARHENAQLRLDLAKWKPAEGTQVPPEREELQRRCHLLAARAESHPYGRKLCQFCGKLKADSGIREHIWRRHREQVAELPASYFDRTQ